MEIRELRYFLAVVREENITRAAESLHIAQPSLSKQIMEPEVCFLPLRPKLPTRLALVWKKHAVLSKAAGAFHNLFL